MGVCKSQRSPEFLEGGEVAQSGHSPCRPVSVCPACCYCPSHRHHCCCCSGCFSDWGKGLSLHLATEKLQSLPLTRKEGWGQRTWRHGAARPLLPPHRGSSTWIPTQNRTAPLLGLVSVLTPEIKGLRTMTSTLLSQWFSFSLL